MTVIELEKDEILSLANSIAQQKPESELAELLYLYYNKIQQNYKMKVYKKVLKDGTTMIQFYRYDFVLYRYRMVSSFFI